MIAKDAPKFFPDKFKELRICATMPFGYVQSDDGTNAIVYRQKLPKFLRWEEGKVSITRPDGSIRVKGPLMILRKLQRALVASQST